MNKRLKTALRIIPVVLLSGVLLVAATRPVAATVPGVNTKVSVDNAGNLGNNHSANSDFSKGSKVTRDKRYAVFNSKATNLVANDTNSKQDVFLRDLAQGTTSRISVSNSGVEGDNDSDFMTISETGRFTIFRSKSTNLIDGETYSGVTYRMYKYDLDTNTTSYIGITSPYAIVSGISSDGRFVALESMNATYQLYLYEIATQTQTRLDNPLDGVQQNVDMASKYAEMSCDGAFIVFESGASNLVVNDTNDKRDIFLADLRNGVKITNLTIGSNGDSKYPEISCNGNYVGFRSTSTTFVSGTSSGANHYYRYDRITGTFEALDRLTSGGIASAPAPTINDSALQLSDKGDAVFTHVNNMSSASSTGSQIYIRNVAATTTERLSVTSAGVASDTAVATPSISADGKLAVYKVSPYNNLIGGTNSWVAVITSETGL